MPTPRVASPQAKIHVDTFQRLQRLDLVRLAVGVMHDSRAGHIAQTIARATQSPGQIDILAVHEYSWLEATDFTHRRCTKQYRSAAHPFSVEAYRIVDFRVLKWNLPHLPCSYPGVVACGIFPQLRERTVFRYRILIQGQHVSRLRILKHAVDSGAKAKIAFATTDRQRQSALLYAAIEIAHNAR